jgi:hypothetical protein
MALGNFPFRNLAFFTFWNADIKEIQYT